MNVTSNNLKLREVINQVVNDPAYKNIAHVPFLSFHQIGLTLFAYSLFFFGLYLAYQDVTLWLVYPIMIFGFYTAFTPLHDATHRAVSSNKFLNDLIGTVSGSLLFPFANTAMYRYFHLAHHRYVGDKKMDPDEAMVGIPAKYFPIGYLAFFVYEYFILRWFFTSVWHRTPTQTKAIIVATFIANITFYVAMFSSPYWYEFLIWFFIPNRLGAAYTSFSFAHLPHPEGVHTEEHPFQATYTLTGNKAVLETFWGQEDHSMHHFLPHIPWYKYKRVWDLANGILHKQGIPEKKVYATPDLHFKERLLESDKVNSTQNLLTVKVKSIKDVALDIKHFTFEAPDRKALPSFTAGSHINITLPSGNVRSYSLINPTYAHETYQIAVKKESNGRGGSAEIHEAIAVGDQLKISIPRNNFVLYENVQKYILISGGIGITPLISMAHRLVELDKHFEFHICARTKAHIPFQFELENWTFAPNVDIHLDKDGKSSIDLSKVLVNCDDQTLLYICGPSGFNQWVKQMALENGWQNHQIKEEYFSADLSSFETSQEFEVVLNKSKKVIKVDESSTMIDALLMNNVNVEYSCLQGTCGTCIVDVINGDIDHRDVVLSDDEKIARDKICLCVSRAKGDRIVLDM